MQAKKYLILAVLMIVAVLVVEVWIVPMVQAKLNKPKTA
jgi:hypothetical protein